MSGNLNERIKSRRGKAIRRSKGKPDSDLAREIASVLDKNRNKLGSLVPLGWSETIKPEIEFDEKNGIVHVDIGQIERVYDYNLYYEPYDDVHGKFINTAYAGDYVVSIEVKDDRIVAGVYSGWFSPERDTGAYVLNGKNGNPPKDIEVVSAVRRGRKPFDPNRDTWKLLRDVVKKADKVMPDWDEFDEDQFKSPTELAFGSETGYWRWKEG